MPAYRDATARRTFLQSLSGDAQSVDAVFQYCESEFDLDRIGESIVFPLGDEPHLADWRRFADEQGDAPFEYLQSRLVQLCLPIRQGISQTDAYADVTRRGKPFDAQRFGAPLKLQEPQHLRFIIHEHPAGALPVFITPVRADFETINRAMISRHEPVDVNPSVNAQLVSGSINWYRVRQYQLAWSANNSHMLGGWAAEMQRVLKDEKWRFFDRFLLMGEEEYSSVRAKTLGLDFDDQRWLEISTVFRLEHEFMHYTTKRLFDSMRLNLFDETVCDWMGMVKAVGEFRPDWFLAFLGITKSGKTRPSSRFHAYSQPLEGDSLALLGDLMVAVSEGLDHLSKGYARRDNQLQFALTLTQMTLELIACSDNDEYFERGYSAIEEKLHH